MATDALADTGTDQGKSEEKVNFYNIHDGLRGRDGGPYLDQMEREAAEIQRAKVEDREPDLDNPGSSAGTPLVPISQVPDNIYANPSMAYEDPLKGPMAKALEENLPDGVVAQELTVDTTTSENQPPADTTETTDTANTPAKTTDTSTSSSPSQTTTSGSSSSTP